MIRAERGGSEAGKKGVPWGRGGRRSTGGVHSKGENAAVGLREQEKLREKSVRAKVRKY
jgi:hypothetical protein